MPNCPADAMEDCLTDLVTLEGKGAVGALRRLVGSVDDQRLRGFGLVRLLGLGDRSCLAEAVKFLRPKAATTDPWIDHARRMLSCKLALVKDGKFVEAHYGPLLRHPSDFVRRDAFYAVRHAEMRSLIPDMIRGLKDSDEDVRYNCVMGLPRVQKKNHTQAPAKSLFLRDEGKYIRYWQTWWKDTGRSSFMKEPPRVPTQP